MAEFQRNVDVKRKRSARNVDVGWTRAVLTDRVANPQAHLNLECEPSANRVEVVVHLTVLPAHRWALTTS